MQIPWASALPSCSKTFRSGSELEPELNERKNVHLLKCLPPSVCFLHDYWDHFVRCTPRKIATFLIKIHDLLHHTSQR